jgi:Tol biopolymer transport system component
MTRPIRRWTIAAAVALVVGSAAGAAQRSPVTTSVEETLGAGLHQALVEGNLEAAIATLEKVAANPAAGRPVVATALLHLGRSYEKLGRPDARAAYERVTREFADQTAVAAEARNRLATLPAARAADTGLMTQQVWAHDFLDGRPSPDGRFIPWIDYPGGVDSGGGNLMLHDLTTGLDRQITRGSSTSFAESPFFTTDGRQVLYAWYERTVDEYQFRIANVDGSSERTLIKGFFYGSPGAVSPDGRTAAVPARTGSSRQIALVDLASAKLTVLASFDWRVPEVGNFSRDGKFLVYSIPVRQDSPDREIHVIAVDGSMQSTLVSGTGEHRDPFFTLDGRQVVFTSNRSGGRWDLWAVPVAKGKASSPPALLKADVGAVQTLGFDREGTLAYRQRVDQRDAYEVEIDPSSWKATSLPKRLSDRFVNSSLAPRWSPDGSLLTYVALRRQISLRDSSEMVFVVRTLATGQERDFTVPLPAGPADNYPNSIQWFPDRRSILLTSYAPQGRQLTRLDLASGQMQRLFVGQGGTLSSIIERDGRSVIYPLTESEDRRAKTLVRHDLETGDEAIVLRDRTGGDGSAAFHGLAMSPDGQQVAYKHADNRTLWVATLPSGRPRQVWTTHQFIGYTVVWAPSGRGLIVSVRDGQFGKVAEAWYVPLDGGEAHPIGIAMPQLTVTSAHPDGRRIAFTGGESSVQLWTLRNLFAETPASR